MRIKMEARYTTNNSKRIHVGQYNENLYVCNKTHKRKGSQGDCAGRHGRRWVFNVSSDDRGSRDDDISVSVDLITSNIQELSCNV